MSTDQLTAQSLESALEAFPLGSTLENLLASSVRAAHGSQKIRLLAIALSSSHPAARAMGIRVLRRSVFERELFDELLTQHCFHLQRYGEIELWYHSILRRYPIIRLARRLQAEVFTQVSPDLCLLHIRALQMWRPQSAALKRRALAVLQDAA
ncbi:hypothetical protein [Piscinibacter sp. HJYY11]|uniref:hypothetical protein n=1 Tax=Piscinibacter sp. HJYY11 TaxID=2801333 RepID=UPI00191D0BFC|nr:hypothetical protein [Piscinibacter sp. HJYY11]MBL0730736.1 hypothetical protein [Piscinibacter sp. HJYY11]